MSNQARFEVYPQMGDFPGNPHRDCVPTGEYGWRFRAANGQITATGGEGFTREEDAERAIEDFCQSLAASMAFGAHGAGVEIVPQITRAER
jgi:uncharacterized protein YegP (UPF0339 family)